MKSKAALASLGILALTLFSLSALASPRCETSPRDPFDPREDALMPGGPFKDQCQNTDSKRAALRLTDAESAPFGGPESGYLYVANVWHFSQYYVAKIPYQSLADVWVQVEHFPPEAVAAHVQMRFSFSSDVELIPQNPTGPDFSILTRDLVFSAEYSAPKGVPFDLVNGLTQFSVVHRMMSLEYKTHYMIDEQHHKVDQLRLVLSEAEKQNILRNALFVARADGMHTMYNTLQHSCATEVFRVLDLSLDFKARESRRTFWRKIGHGLEYLPGEALKSVYDRMPVLTRNALERRELLDSSSFSELHSSSGRTR